MAELAISREFLPAYARLQRPVQRAVMAVFAKFSEHTHAGLHLEKITGARDPRIRTIRVDDFYRGVVLALGDQDYVLHTVLPHDNAIDFAIRHVVTVNSAIGVLELRDQALIDELAPIQLPSTTPRLFDRVSDKDFRRLGIDPQLLPLIRTVVTEAQLAGFAVMLPAAQYDVLTGLASGMTAAEVWSELASRILANVDTEDAVAAARRTPEEIRFVEGPHELAAILAYPFHVWRTFLHPTQHDVAYRDQFTGPAQVTGSAGTGKTVTGLHRAVFLAKRLPGNGAKVLFTTYTRALASSLTTQLRLLTEDRAVLERIEVIGIDQLARKIVAETRGGRAPKIADEALLRKLWEHASANAPRYWNSAGQPVALSGAFLQREWEQVILAQQLSTVEEYRNASRRGRGGTLRAETREQIWAVIVGFVAELARQRRHTYLQIAEDAATIAAAVGSGRYSHIIVDEGQDLHPAQWRLLRALVQPGPNDLFILADPHQRIYDSHVSFKSLGIGVSGRSRRLTVNYRTTHEILDWSVKVLNADPAVGLDDQFDSLTGYRSITRGSSPVITAYGDRGEELDSLVERVGTWLEQGVEAHAIGVAARTNYLVDTIAKTLREAYIPVADEAAAQVGVHVATMHGMKGLEFRCLAVVGLDASVLPAANAITAADEDPLSHHQDMQRERCLLFVAATRARDMLYLSHMGKPSSLLP